jgi:ketosteroid isomerase-like protein
MGSKVRTAVLLILAALVCTASTSASPRKDVLAKFYELRARMLGELGTEADVDALLNLLTPDASYEHPAFGVKMTKVEARAGMLAHLREGKNVRFSVHSVRFGEGFAVVEVTLHYTVKGTPIERPGVGIFEFKDNRISRVAEY